MTNAEKEARALAISLMDDCARMGGMPHWKVGNWQDLLAEEVDRILSFAREYGPEIARQHAGQDSTLAAGTDPDAFGRFLRGDTVTTSLSPVEDTTPLDWSGRVEIPGLTPGAHPVARFPLGTPQRGKPF